MRGEKEKMRKRGRWRKGREEREIYREMEGWREGGREKREQAQTQPFITILKP